MYSKVNNTFEYIFKKGFIMGFNEKLASKIYIGDAGGQAQMIVGPFGVHKYEGNVEKLSSARYDLAATTVGNYALFGGGWGNSKTSDIVDAYDASLTRIAPTVLSSARYKLAATTVGNYALFAGGNISSGQSGGRPRSVNAYDTSLTRTNAPALGLVKVDLAATTVGNHALFGFGDIEIMMHPMNNPLVVAYDTSLTQTYLGPNANKTKTSLAATTVGNYALFGGGRFLDLEQTPNEVVDV